MTSQKPIKPMLARLTKEPFDDENWLFEIKWDGYRALAYCDLGKVNLLSRNNLSFNDLFSPLVKDLSKLKTQAILDGEVVVLDNEGKSHFQLMQNYQKDKKGNLYYCVFDLLFLNGKDLRDLPLIERKAMLKKLIQTSACRLVRFSDHIEEQGKAFFKEAQKQQLEGIIAKKKESPYLSTRSSYWLKIKTHQRQEAIIVGYTQPRGSRKHFGALLLAVYEKKQLRYIGHVGGGFDSRSLHDLFAAMQPYVQAKCPLRTVPKTNTPAIWLQPKLICEVTFAEWTNEGLLRQPIFQGLRIDKSAREVKREAS